MEFIESKDDLSLVLAKSYEHRVAIFKLSNTCPQSKMLFERLKRTEEKDPSITEKISIIIVQKTREVSDEVALRFGVVHESPQVLVVENEEVIYYQSHEHISLDKVKELLQKGGNEDFFSQDFSML